MSFACEMELNRVRSHGRDTAPQTTANPRAEELSDGVVSRGEGIRRGVKRGDGYRMTGDRRGGTGSGERVQSPNFRLDEKARKRGEGNGI
jgi:hypothetical protein